MIIFNIPLVPQILKTFERIGLPVWTAAAAVAIVCGATILIIHLLVKTRILEKIRKTRIKFNIYRVIFSIMTAVFVTFFCRLIVASTETAGASLQQTCCGVILGIMFWWIGSYYAIPASEQPVKKSFKVIAQKALPVVLLCALMIFHILNDFYLVPLSDVLQNYSEGYQIAEYIDSNVPAGEDIYGNSMECISILAANIKENHKLIYPTYDQPVTYAVWFNGWNRKTHEKDWLTIWEEIVEEKGCVYFVISDVGTDYAGFDRWMRENEESIELLFETEKNQLAKEITHESFYLYKYTAHND